MKMNRKFMPIDMSIPMGDIPIPIPNPSTCILRQMGLWFRELRKG
jgi:hypothetical protein